MSKNQQASGLINVINYDSNGNISFVSGSTTLMQISASGQIAVTGVISGSSAQSASLAQNSLLLGGTGSLAFATTSSFSAASSSMSSRVTQIETVYATTGSNSFRANQSITGSLTVTGQIIAQTINVQQVTSSIVYSSGSNVFGCDINSRQTFTGSMYVTGSSIIANVTNACFQGSVCSPSFVGGVLSGTTVCTSNGIIGTNSNNLYLSSNSSAGEISFWGNQLNTRLMTISGSGNVGIGTNAPCTLLHIATTRTSGTNVNVITLSDNVTGVQTPGYGARIQYYSNGSGVQAAIGLENGGTGTNNESQISFYTQGTAGALTKQLTIGSNGVATFTTNVTTGGDITIPNGNYYYAKRNTGGSAIAVMGFAAGSDTLTIKGGTSGAATAIQFQDTGGTVMSLYNGNVGIGASVAPVYKLEVSTAGGSERIRVGTLQNNNNTARFEAITSSTVSTASSAWLRANYAGGLTLGVSSYTKAGGDSGNFNCLSAESATDILTLTGAGIACFACQICMPVGFVVGGTNNTTTNAGIRRFIGFGSSFNNPNQGLFNVTSVPTNSTLIAKVTVFQNAFGQAASNSHTGYAMYYWNGCTACAMSVDYNLGTANVGSLAWCGSCLTYTSNRASNYDSYNVAIDFSSSSGNVAVTWLA